MPNQLAPLVSPYYIVTYKNDNFKDRYEKPLSNSFICDWCAQLTHFVNMAWYFYCKTGTNSDSKNPENA
jgi:hypothetical protein